MKNDNASKVDTVPLLIDDFEQVIAYSDKLIKQHHPHLLTANIRYLCRNKAPKSQGKLVPGVIKKASPIEKHLSGSEADFIMMISLDVWNSMPAAQRLALVDHLLTRCVASEDEKTGKLKFSMRSPDVQEFAEVVSRNGLWNEQIAEFVDSAK